MSRLVRTISKSNDIFHAGIHLGYMRRKKTHTGFERSFLLSYEGGAFLHHYINQFHPSLPEYQKIQLDEEGEKKFLYGQDVSFDDILTETEKLTKKRIIFVENEQGNYLGIALLLVKQAGAKKPIDHEKERDDYSRSPNFRLRLMTLSDAGYYVRKGH